MDPELKALLRSMKPGSREYQATVNKYMTDKAAREGAVAERSARIQREQDDAAAARERQALEQRAAQEALSRLDPELQTQLSGVQPGSPEWQTVVNDFAARKAAEEQQTGMVAAGSVAGGLGVGLLGAKYANTVATDAADKVLASRGEGLSKLAGAARAIDPNAPGSQGLYRDIGNAAQRSGVTNPRVMPLGTGLTGLGLLGAGAYSSFDRAPNSKSDVERAIWTGTGYGELGAGVKMLADSARRYGNPNVTLPTDDLAAVEGAQRMGAGGRVAGPVAPPSTASAYAAPASATVTPGRLAQALMPEITPETVPPVIDNTRAPTAPPAETDASQAAAKQRHRDRLITAAKETGANGPLTKTGAAEHLLANVTDANRGAVAKSLGVSNGPNLHKRLMAAIKDMASKPGASAILAGLAGATAASIDPAEAADGSGGGLTDRAIAGGTAAGTAYGISRLAQALGPIASGALATGGTMMTPMAISDAVDEGYWTPERMEAAAFDDAQRIPEWSRRLSAWLGFPAAENAYQMAQLPARGERSGPMSQAPEPAAAPMTPIPDAEAPYSPMVMGRLSRMRKFGATPEQIAHFLNQAVR